MNAVAKISRFKRAAFRLPVMDDGGREIATLDPITDLQCLDTGVLDKIVDWRNRFRTAFKTQFTATKADTREWLQRDVIASPSRVLFLVMVEDTFVGHVGLTNITDETAELDNILRGERIGHPNCFVFALRTLMNFAFNQLAVDRIESKVFSDNARAVRLYKKLKMIELSTSPLVKHEQDGRIIYEECRAEDANVTFRYATLTISRHEFSEATRTG